MISLVSYVDDTYSRHLAYDLSTILNKYHTIENKLKALEKARQTNTTEYKISYRDLEIITLHRMILEKEEEKNHQISELEKRIDLLESLIISHSRIIALYVKAAQDE